MVRNATVKRLSFFRKDSACQLTQAMLSSTSMKAKVQPETLAAAFQYARRRWISSSVRPGAESDSCALRLAKIPPLPQAVQDEFSGLRDAARTQCQYRIARSRLLHSGCGGIGY